jgi:hypothetical protein
MNAECLGYGSVGRKTDAGFRWRQWMVVVANARFTSEGALVDCFLSRKPKVRWRTFY